MDDGGERRVRSSTNGVGDGVGGGELGVLFLEILELALQPIEICIGELRRILLVVEPAVVRNLLAKLGDSAGGVRFWCHMAMLSQWCVATFGAVNVVEPQLLRVLWLVLPFAASPVFEAGLDTAERGLRVGGGILLWLVWALLLIALMVPRTETLTAVRAGIPAALPLVLWALFAHNAADDASLSSVVVVLSTAIAAVVAVLAWRAPVGDLFVDGSSYGDERRFLLRTPGALAIGPLPLLWVVLVAAVVAGPLLLLMQQWIVGVLLTAAGIPVAWVAIQALHRLSQRWLVFVPAGVVVHDKTALREPQLFRVQDVDAFGPAPANAESTSEDLSLGSMGLVLRASLSEMQKVMRNDQGDQVELTEIEAFLVAPNRPGAVVIEAADRGFTIG